MKKSLKYITEYIRPPLLILMILLIASGVVGQNKNTTGVESRSQQSVNTCGTYPASGTLAHGTSTLTAGSGCNTTIMPGSSTVYFTAGNNIILYPGFTALNGSKFIARIEANSVVSQANVSEKEAIANEDNFQSVTVTPNPFTGTFVATISSKKGGKARVTVYNSYGIKVKEQAGVNLLKGINKTSLNCSNLASGVYMLEVSFDDSKIVTRIIKGN